MKRLPLLFVVIISLMFLGCAGMSDTQQRTLSGGAIGAGAGAVVGAIAGNTALGAAVGAAGGAAGGYLYDRTKSQERNQTTTLTLQPNTVIIDNNDPVHWELLKKSFTPEAGRQYKINVIVPQGAVIQTIEFGVDTARQFVNIGSKSYECIVAREPNYEITLYFYEGNLIQYKNNPDGIVIVKKMS